MTRLYLLAIPVILFQFLDAGAAYAGNTALYLTLEESIEICLSENRQLKASHSRIAQADQQLNQTRCDFFPKLSMTYGYKKSDAPETIDLELPRSGPVSIDISSTENFQWAGAISQPLFKGFRILGKYRWAVLGLDRARADAALDKLDMVLRAKKAYFDLLVAEKAVQVAQQAMRALRAHIETAQAFFELEMIAVNDLLKARVQLSNTEYELTRALNNVRHSRAALNTLLALPIETRISIEDILVYTPVEKQYDVCVTQALKHRPEIRSIQLALRQIDQQIIMERSDIYPDIGLQYRYIKEGDSYNVSGGQFHEADRWEISAVMSWTIWEWGKTHYAVSENKSKHDELQNLEAAQADNIRLEIKNALLNLGQADENVPKAAQSVEQGKENLRASQERFNIQAAASTDVLDAQTLLTRAELNYYRAVYEHNLAKADLDRAMGIY